VSCNLTKHDRFFIHKVIETVIIRILHIQHLDVLLLSLLVSCRGRICLLSMPYTFDMSFKCSNLEMSFKDIGNSMFEIQHCFVMRIQWFSIRIYFCRGYRAETTDHAKHVLSVECTLITAHFVAISRSTSIWHPARMDLVCLCDSQIQYTWQCPLAVAFLELFERRQRARWRRYHANRSI